MLWGKLKFLFNIFIIFFLFSSSIQPQFKRDKNPFNHNPRKVFHEIGKGLKNGEISSFAPYFRNETYISLLNGNSNYYSVNQAYYVLQDFFAVYRAINFRYSNIVTNTNSPFAYGTYVYFFRGARNTAQVFISLKREKRKWIIAQFTIN